MKKILYPDTKFSDYAECMFPQMGLVNNNTICKNENNEFKDFHLKRMWHIILTQLNLACG